MADPKFKIEFTANVTPEERQRLTEFVAQARAVVPDVDRHIQAAADLHQKPVTLRFSNDNTASASADQPTNTLRLDTKFLDGFGTRNDAGCVVRRPLAVTLAHELAHLSDRALAAGQKAVDATKNDPTFRAAQEVEILQRYAAASPETQSAMREMLGRDPNATAAQNQAVLARAGITNPQQLGEYLTQQRERVTQQSEQHKFNSEDRVAVVAEDKVAAQYHPSQGVPQRVHYANVFERQADGSAKQNGFLGAQRFPWCDSQPDLMALPQPTLAQPAPAPALDRER